PQDRGRHPSARRRQRRRIREAVRRDAAGDGGKLSPTLHIDVHQGRRRMKIDLSGKTALVTGSTAGIGYAIARGLATSGADVVINGRSQDKVDASVRKL